MDLFTVALTILLGSFLYWFYQHTRKPPNFPPGPKRWPVLGSLLEMFPAMPPSTLASNEYLRKKHGDVFGMYVSNEPVVVFSGYETIKELFKKDEASGRGPFKPYNQARPGGEDRQEGDAPGEYGLYHIHTDHAKLSLSLNILGVVNPNGQEWIEQRRFALRHLREFGFGKASMEDMFSEEINRLCDMYRK